MRKNLVLIFISLIILTGCVDKNIQKNDNTINLPIIQTEKITYPEPKNIMVNGVDYLQSQDEVGKFGGEFVSSTIGDGPKTFNPWESKDATSSSVAEMLYDGLAETNVNTGEIIPKLAKKIEVLPDKVTYRIFLRHGVKWSDGKPITADDVVFTWDKIIFAGLGNTSTRDSLYIDGVLPKVKKINDYEVEFKTYKPFAPFLRALTTPIAPKHIMEKVAQKGASDFSAYMSGSSNPKDFVTSGPFMIEEYKTAQRIVLKRNPNYYKIDKNKQKLPYLDKYIILIVGNTNNQLLKFQSGELDIIPIEGANVEAFKAQENKKTSDFKIYNLGASTSTSYLAFNLSKEKDKDGNYYVDPIKQTWFNDLNFRKAIEYALDRKSFILNVANGVGVPLYTAESPTSIYLNKNLKEPEYNIEKSKSLLKKSGFYYDKNGILYDKSGNKVEFSLYTNSGNLAREAIGVSIKQDLSKIGITVNFKPMEFNTLVNKLLGTLDWESVIMGFTGSPLDPHGGLNVWHSSGTLHLFNKKTGDKPQSVSNWELTLNDIFEKAALELDFEKRKKLYDEYQKIVYEQKPIIYLYSPLRITAIRTKFKNIYPTPLGDVLHNLDEIYIEEK